MDRMKRTATVAELLHRGSQVADQIFSQGIGSAGLTARQHAVLAAVKVNPDASQARLVAETGIDRSTLSELTGRLVRRGLVERVRSERDARANRLAFTAAGEDILEKLRGPSRAAERRLIARLPAGGREQLVALLKALLTDPGDDGALPRNPRHAKSP